MRKIVLERYEGRWYIRYPLLYEGRGMSARAIVRGIFFNKFPFDSFHRTDGIKVFDLETGKMSTYVGDKLLKAKEKARERKLKVIKLRALEWEESCP